MSLSGSWNFSSNPAMKKRKRIKDCEERESEEEEDK
jgi:hypothetical protein